MTRPPIARPPIARLPIAVGIDLVHVPRIERNAQSLGGAFLNRSFTSAEQDLCAGDAHRLAGRWAVKESVLKALGMGIGELALTDIEVLAEKSGAPRLLLHGSAAQAATDAGLSDWSVSISHDGEYATAVVVAVRAA